MTPLSHNRAEFVTALQAMFGLKGQMPSFLEVGISPVLALANLWDSPYLRYGIPVAEQLAQAGVAAENAYVIAQPGPAVALQIKQIIVTNDTGAAQLVAITVMTAAQIAAASIAAASVPMLDLAAQVAGTTRSSKVISGTHTSLLGNSFDVIALPANSTTVYTLPDPGVILYGNDEGGVPGLAAINAGLADSLRAGFKGREWPLPG